MKCDFCQSLTVTDESYSAACSKSIEDAKRLFSWYPQEIKFLFNYDKFERKYTITINKICYKCSVNSVNQVS
jgi:hypothetical protein